MAFSSTRTREKQAAEIRIGISLLDQWWKDEVELAARNLYSLAGIKVGLPWSLTKHVAVCTGPDSPRLHRTFDDLSKEKQPLAFDSAPHVPHMLKNYKNFEQLELSTKQYRKLRKHYPCRISNPTQFELERILGVRKVLRSLHSTYHLKGNHLRVTQARAL